MATPADPLAGLRRHYTDALLGGDPRGATGLVEDAARAGTAVEDLYLDVLQPALQEVGDRWERGEISVAQEHFATAVTSSVLAAIAGRMSFRPRGRGYALVTGTPGERHAVGARMVADFLDAAGWEAEHLTEPESAEAIAAAVIRSRAARRALDLAAMAAARGAPRLRRAQGAAEPAARGGRRTRLPRRSPPRGAGGADDFATDPRRLLALLDAEAVARTATTRRRPPAGS